MRALKFRGLDTNKNWVYGSYHPCVGLAILSDRDYEGNDKVRNVDLDCHWILVNTMPEGSGWEIRDTFISVKVDGKTVGQFTGLLDKNGNEIYEGDIVVSESADNTAYVKFGKYEGRLKGFPDHCDELEMHGWLMQHVKRSDLCEPLDESFREGEIVGNIYENPELLNPSPSNVN